MNDYRMHVLIFVSSLLIFALFSPVQAQNILTPILPNDLQISPMSGSWGSSDTAFDGTKFLVIWMKYDSNTNGGMWGQFVTPEGTLLGDPIQISTTGSGSNPAIAFNGVNYCVVYSTTSWEIAGKIISSQGIVGQEFVISNTENTRYSPAIANSGQDFLVVWNDYRSFATNYGDIYGQRLSSSGSRIGENFLISSAQKNQYLPKITSDGNNYLVAWMETPVINAPMADWDIYGARVSPTGVVLDPNGFPISNAAGFQGAGNEGVGLAFGDNDFLAAYSDWHDPLNQGIYTTRISREGVLLDGPSDNGGIFLARENANTGTRCAFDGKDWLVIWGDGESHVRGGRLTTEGVALDSIYGTTLSTVGGHSLPRSNIPYNGDFFITWISYSFFKTDPSDNSATLYGQIISVEPFNQIPITITDSYTTNEDIPLTITGNGILGNDIDQDGDPLTAILVSDVSHGSLTLNTDGSFIYIPEANYHGTDSFYYKANDGSLDSSSSIVSINIYSVNDAPIAASVSTTCAEDTILPIQLAGSDVDNDILTYSLIDGPSHGTLIGTAPYLTYNPTQNYYGEDGFTFKVSDGHGGVASATVAFTITSVNDPVVIGVIAPIVNPSPLGTEVSLSASFSDPDILDTYTATWTWGDGTQTSGSINARTVTGSHTYSAVDVYTVTLTISDGSAESQDVYQYVVIYNPNAGYVTGHGQIHSPAGAYIADTSLTGPATFGFVSKYQRGANVPDGNTRFRFQVADFDFRSTSYEWLVIAGAKAQYKGLGNINGQGPYKFMLSSVDADQNTADTFNVDRFRIRIWSEDVDGKEHTIYDNSIGTEVDLNSATEIIKGEIDIRKEAL